MLIKPRRYGYKRLHDSRILLADTLCMLRCDHGLNFSLKGIEGCFGFAATLAYDIIWFGCVDFVESGTTPFINIPYNCLFELLDTT